MNKYQFEYENMDFSKDGSWDELIALDRYTVPTYDGYRIGDTVVALVDKQTQAKKIGEIIEVLNDTTFKVKDRLGEIHTVESELLHKPLETKPVQLWDRWAKGGTSVEEYNRELWENQFRRLLDGYRYSLGGRIQLMLGQEFVTGNKANLTAYNCYVTKYPRSYEDPCQQFLDVIDAAYIEASVMRRGGGDGINISHMNTVKGSGKTKSDFVFYIDESHKDYPELQDRIKLNKITGVTIVTNKQQYDAIWDAEEIKAIDSVDNGLFENLKDMVVKSYNGSRIKIDFNPLRHRKAIVKGVNGRSSGAESWMELFMLVAQLLQQDTIDNVDFAEIFSFIVGLIEQGGSRRGALMLICNIDNPNVRKFIERKREQDHLGKGKWLTGANISVGIDESFMQRVKLAKRLTQFELEKDSNANLRESVDLWNLMIESAWASAEPGIVWLERYNKESNSWYFHDIVCTNPCGEQGLPEFGVCNLGHHVLSRYYLEEPVQKFSIVSKPNSEMYYPLWNELKQYPNVDWDELALSCHTAQRLQDNIIDYTPYFLEENRNVQLSERRVGIGSMALGTLMIKLGLRYGAEDGLKFIDVLYKFMAYQHYKASMLIAKDKGAFPAFRYNYFIQSGFMQRLLKVFPDLDGLLQKYGIRNVTSLTQAPTGSTGTYIDNIPEFVEKFGGATTGIEPYFAFTFWRASRLGFTEQTCHIAQQYMDKHGLTSIDQLPEWFVTAMDLSPSDHVKVQAAIQKWCDSSISKTANCPNDYTIEQTDELYMLSYDLGLKGMTIYRDGSRNAQVLATNKEDAKLESHIEAEKLAELKALEDEQKEIITETSVKPVEREIEKRPSRLFGFTEKVKVLFGDRVVKAYITINVDKNNHPIEVFIVSSDTELDQLAAVIGRLTTQFLRFGDTRDNLDQVVKHLRKGQSLTTLPSKVASLLEQVAYGKIVISDGEGVKKEAKKPIFRKCPDCGEEFFDKANCICVKCGSSKCN